MNTDKKHLTFLVSSFLLVVSLYVLYPIVLTSTAVSANTVTLDELKPDLVLFNGKIVTVDEDFSIAEAVAIKDGKFVAVGTNDEIRALWDKTLRREISRVKRFYPASSIPTSTLLTRWERSTIPLRTCSVERVPLRR